MQQKGSPVLISLNASATADGGETDAISLLTSGELSKEEDGYLLCYEEALDESSAPTKVKLLMQTDVITMHRSGDYEANMVFRKGQRYEGQYNTPYGSMDLALFCTRATYTVDEHGGELKLQYQLDINGQYIAMHEMELCFAVRESDSE